MISFFVQNCKVRVLLVNNGLLSKGLYLSLTAGATAKQSGSLEDFKKIAEKNGITVCPAGNEILRKT